MFLLWIYIYIYIYILYALYINFLIFTIILLYYYIMLAKLLGRDLHILAEKYTVS